VMMRAKAAACRGDEKLRLQAAAACRLVLALASELLAMVAQGCHRDQGCNPVWCRRRRARR